VIVEQRDDSELFVGFLRFQIRLFAAAFFPVVDDDRLCVVQNIYLVVSQ
jgi:hypothetical protein